MPEKNISYIRISTIDQNPERQLEGIELAKKRGVYKGRKLSLFEEQIQNIKNRINAGEQKAKLAKKFGISREKLYQYLRLSLNHFYCFLISTRRKFMGYFSFSLPITINETKTPFFSSDL